MIFISFLPLATCTEVSAAIPLPDTLDETSAADTGISLPLKYFQVHLIFTRISLQINKIRKTGAAHPDCTA